MYYAVEYTDTFGGDANYSWVRREIVAVEDACSDRALMRRAKKAVGLTAVRGTTTSFGDVIEFRPYGMCTVMFITPQY
jgi:hypothetical protein